MSDTPRTDHMQTTQPMAATNFARQMERELNEAKLNIENADENFREICILFGFDPSDGEGTSYEQVVGAAKRATDQLRAELEKVREVARKLALHLKNEFGEDNWRLEAFTELEKSK